MSEPKLIGDVLGGIDYAKAFPYPYTEEQNQQFMRENEREAQRREALDFEHLKSGKAFRGVYGENCKGIALAWSRDYAIRPEQIDGLHFQHKPALEALRRMLSSIPDRDHG